jgi:hypothetical protein
MKLQSHVNSGDISPKEVWAVRLKEEKVKEMSFELFQQGRRRKRKRKQR